MLAQSSDLIESGLTVLALCAVALPVLIFIRRQWRVATDGNIRRSCPQCDVTNVVEPGQLGKRVRCANCGSLLYPSEHPTTKATLPKADQVAEPGPPPSPHVIERIFERQVLVERCTHCGQLSPVDTRGCQQCGAPRAQG